MTTAHPAPAQVLRLLADYYEQNCPFWDGSGPGEKYDAWERTMDQFAALDPATLRAQAEALAEQEAEATQLREALGRAEDLARRWLSATPDGSMFGGYLAMRAFGQELANTLTPTQEAPQS